MGHLSSFYKNSPRNSSPRVPEAVSLTWNSSSNLYTDASELIQRRGRSPRKNIFERGESSESNSNYYMPTLGRRAISSSPRHKLPHFHGDDGTDSEDSHDPSPFLELEFHRKRTMEQSIDEVSLMTDPTSGDSPHRRRQSSREAPESFSFSSEHQKRRQNVPREPRSSRRYDVTTIYSAEEPPSEGEATLDHQHSDDYEEDCYSHQEVSLADPPSQRSFEDQQRPSSSEDDQHPLVLDSTSSSAVSWTSHLGRHRTGGSSVSSFVDPPTGRSDSTDQEDHDDAISTASSRFGKPDAPSPSRKSRNSSPSKKQHPRVGIAHTMSASHLSPKRSSSERIRSDRFGKYDITPSIDRGQYKLDAAPSMTLSTDSPDAYVEPNPEQVVRPDPSVSSSDESNANGRSRRSFLPRDPSTDEASADERPIILDSSSEQATSSIEGKGAKATSNRNLQEHAAQNKTDHQNVEKCVSQDTDSSINDDKKADNHGIQQTNSGKSDDRSRMYSAPDTSSSYDSSDGFTDSGDDIGGCAKPSLLPHDLQGLKGFFSCFTSGFGKMYSDPQGSLNNNQATFGALGTIEETQEFNNLDSAAKSNKNKEETQKKADSLSEKKKSEKAEQVKKDSLDLNKVISNETSNEKALIDDDVSTSSSVRTADLGRRDPQDNGTAEQEKEQQQTTSTELVTPECAEEKRTACYAASTITDDALPKHSQPQEQSDVMGGETQSDLVEDSAKSCGLQQETTEKPTEECSIVGSESKESSRELETTSAVELQNSISEEIWDKISRNESPIDVTFSTSQPIKAALNPTSPIEKKYITESIEAQFAADSTRGAEEKSTRLSTFLDKIGQDLDSGDEASIGDSDGGSTNGGSTVFFSDGSVGENGQTPLVTEILKPELEILGDILSDGEAYRSVNESSSNEDESSTRSEEENQEADDHSSASEISHSYDVDAVVEEAPDLLSDGEAYATEDDEAYKTSAEDEAYKSSDDAYKSSHEDDDFSMASANSKNESGKGHSEAQNDLENSLPTRPRSLDENDSSARSVSGSTSRKTPDTGAFEFSNGNLESLSESVREDFDEHRRELLGSKRFESAKQRRGLGPSIEPTESTPISSPCHEIVEESSKTADVVLQTYQDFLVGVIKLQANVRRKLATRLSHRRLGALIRIQNQMRKSLAETKVSEMRSEKLRKDSATTIQNATRMMFARSVVSHVRKEKKLNDSAVCIQCSTRVLIAKASLRRLRQAKKQNDSATIIQATYRRFLQVKQYRNIRRCIICIQSQFRMIREVKFFIVAKNSAIAIQSSQRRRSAVSAFSLLRKATIVVQAISRCFIAQTQVQLKEKRAACVLIQSHARKLRPMEDLNRSIQASVVIQSEIRRMLSESHFDEAKKAVLAVQTAWRMHWILSRFQTSRKGMVQLQAVLRTRGELRKYQSLRSASIKVQTFARCRTASKSYKTIRSKVVAIQRFLRASLAIKVAEAKRKAVVVLQSFERMRQAHKKARAARIVMQIEEAFLSVSKSMDSHVDIVMSTESDEVPENADATKVAEIMGIQDDEKSVAEGSSIGEGTTESSVASTTGSTADQSVGLNTLNGNETQKPQPEPAPEVPFFPSRPMSPLSMNTSHMSQNVPKCPPIVVVVGEEQEEDDDDFEGDGANSLVAQDDSPKTIAMVQFFKQFVPSACDPICEPMNNARSDDSIETPVPTQVDVAPTNSLLLQDDNSIVNEIKKRGTAELLVKPDQSDSNDEQSATGRSRFTRATDFTSFTGNQSTRFGTGIRNPCGPMMGGFGDVGSSGSEGMTSFEEDETATKDKRSKSKKATFKLGGMKVVFDDNTTADGKSFPGRDFGNCAQETPRASNIKNDATNLANEMLSDLKDMAQKMEVMAEKTAKDTADLAKVTAKKTVEIAEETAENAKKVFMNNSASSSDEDSRRGRSHYNDVETERTSFDETREDYTIDGSIDSSVESNSYSRSYRQSRRDGRGKDGAFDSMVDNALDFLGFSPNTTQHFFPASPRRDIAEELEDLRNPPSASFSVDHRYSSKRKDRPDPQGSPAGRYLPSPSKSSRPRRNIPYFRTPVEDEQEGDLTSNDQLFQLLANMLVEFFQSKLVYGSNTLVLLPEDKSQVDIILPRAKEAEFIQALKERLQEVESITQPTVKDAVLKCKQFGFDLVETLNPILIARSIGADPVEIPLATTSSTTEKSIEAPPSLVENHDVARTQLVGELQQAKTLMEGSESPKTKEFWLNHVTVLQNRLKSIENPSTSVGGYLPPTPTNQDPDHDESELVDVISPADLPGGYHFEAEIEGHRFIATVPRGGVQKGETFSCAMRELDSVAVDIPVGHWKDSMSNTCSLGMFHASLCNAIFCPLIALAQTGQRIQLDFLGRPRHPESDQHFSNRNMMSIIIGFWALLNALILTGFGFKSFYNVDLSIADYSALAVVNGAMVAFTIFVAQSTRYSLREKFMIREEHCYDLEDLVYSICCLPCVVSQMMRHTANYSDHHALCCSHTGLPDGVGQDQENFNAKPESAYFV